MYNDEEMKQPATKADIHKLETTTRVDIQRLDTKTDRIIKEMVRGFARSEAAQTGLCDQFQGFRSDILKAVEVFMGQVGKVDRRQIIVDHRIDRLEKRVDKIETRPRA